MKRPGCLTVLLSLAAVLAVCPHTRAFAKYHTVIQEASVQGIVSDLYSGRSLEGANVVMKELSTPDSERATLGTSTDRNGFYRIGGLEPGRYEFNVSYVGYVNYRDTLTLEAGASLQVSVDMEPAELQLDELIIELPGSAARREIGRQRVRPSDLGRVPTPSASGDLVNYLQVMPGVVTTGDRGGQLFIRGGTPSQNMVLVDGMMIYQPFHILGFFSAFPEDLIAGADFYAGGFGARYSGRISSVLDVQIRDGNRNEMKGSGSISPFLGEILVEGPVQRGRSSWIFSARRSLIEETSPSFLNETQPLRFESQYLKYTHFEEDNTRCSATAMRTYDRGSLDYESDYHVRWSNYLLGGRCLVMPEEMDFLVNMNFNISYMSNATNDRGLDFYSDITRVHTDVNITRFFREYQLDYGLFVHMKYYHYDLQELFHAFQEKKNTMLGTGAYLEATIPLGERVQIHPGAALSVYPREYAPSFEPRFRATWEPFGRETEQFTGAMGLYRQSLTGISDMRDAGSAFVAWMPSPDDDSRAQALHTLLGWQQTLFRGFQWSLEGYYKRMDHLPVAVWSSIAKFTTELSQARGHVYGSDLRLEYRRGPFYMLAGYGYSLTEYQAEQDHFSVWFGEPVQRYNPPHDRRHQLNLLSSLELGSYMVSARFQYGTGMPFTRPLGFDAIKRFTTTISHYPYGAPQNPVTELPDVRNTYGTPRVIIDRPYDGRLPDYHRLDLSVERSVQLNTGLLHIQAGAINTYGHTNIFYYDIYTHRRVDQISFVPYVSLKLEYQ